MKRYLVCQMAHIGIMTETNQDSIGPFIKIINDFATYLEADTFKNSSDEEDLFIIEAEC